MCAFVRILNFIISIVACLFCSHVFGQSVGNYSVLRSTGITYSSIASSGSSFASWRYNGTYSEDDNRSNLTDIGFDFWYNGIRYTQFSVSTNGFLDFSSSKDDEGLKVMISDILIQPLLKLLSETQRGQH